MQVMNKLIDALRTSRGAIEVYDGARKRRVPFAEVYAGVCGVAAFLEQQGLVKGDRVGVIGRNCYEWVLVDLACIARGLVTVPFDHEDTYDYGSLMATFELRVLFADGVADRQSASGMFPLQAIRRLTPDDPPDLAPARYLPDDILTVKFTSGSTDSPKAIATKIKSVDATIVAVQTLFHHDHSDRVMVFLPLFLAQQRYWIYSAILYGYTVLVVPYVFVFRSLAADRPTVVMGVPGFFEALARKYAQRATPELSFADMTGGSIRYLWSGSAPLARETLRFYERMGVALYQGYGTNETCIVSKNFEGHNRPGSVGRPLPGKQVEFDEEQQILVRSEQEVNDRYLGIGLDESRHVFLPDGRVGTGDIGHVDEDGYLYITGRKKDIVVLASGRKVHPGLVEKRIEALPDVRHCLVYGDGRPSLVALVVPANEDGDHMALRRQLVEVSRTLARDHRLHNALVIDEHQLAARGLVSGQLKLRRRHALEVFRGQLDRLYR
jgi:long-chain acyl-CoA synthetase